MISIVTMRNLPKTKPAKSCYAAIIFCDLVAETVIRGHAHTSLHIYCTFLFSFTSSESGDIINTDTVYGIIPNKGTPLIEARPNFEGQFVTVAPGSLNLI